MQRRDANSLLARFERCELTAKEFGHRQHVRAAWELLSQCPPAQAVPRFTAAVRRFAAHHDQPDLYHETITWAFLFAINERIHRLPAGHAWDEFADANPELLKGSRRFLGAYYSPERLASPVARRHFVLPDRAGLATG